MLVNLFFQENYENVQNYSQTNYWERTEKKMIFWKITFFDNVVSKLALLICIQRKGNTTNKNIRRQLKFWGKIV